MIVILLLSYSLIFFSVGLCAIFYLFLALLGCDCYISGNEDLWWILAYNLALNLDWREVVFMKIQYIYWWVLFSLFIN